MDFEKLFEDLTIKADNLDMAIKILSNKSSHLDCINVLKDESKDIKELELLIKEAIDLQKNEIKHEYSYVKDMVQNVNEKMLFLLSEIEKTNTQHSNPHSSQPEGKTSKTKLLFNELGSCSLFSELNTPRMSIDQYSKSPFAKAKRSTKLQLQFSDFEFEITKDMFDRIPAYIRGRLHLSDLQSFLDETVIKCFNSKYELFYKNRALLKPSDYSLQAFYKEQSSYFEGQKFITMGDISRIMGKNVDKKDEKYLQCLRFLNIIKEMRKNSATCYIWVEK